MSDPSQGPKIEELEQIYQFLQERGDRVKTLLLTNPNNPLGTIYSPTVIQNCVCWARSKNMHTIVDEIYALSVHNVSGYHRIVDMYKDIIIYTYIPHSTEIYQQQKRKTITTSNLL